MTFDNIQFEKLNKRIKDLHQDGLRGVSRTENTFVTYGGFHVLTLCSKLEEVYPEKTDDELIQNALDIITECLLESGQPAYYTFFRDSKMTDKMIEKCYQLDLFDKDKEAKVA